MGLFDIFTGSKAIKPMPAAKSNWQDYDVIVSSIIDNPTLRKSAERWFDKDLLLKKVQEKAKTQEIDAAVHDALTEQLNILREKLARIEAKVDMRADDVRGVISHHPTPNAVPLLSEEDLHTLFNRLDDLQRAIRDLNLYVNTQAERIPKRDSWQAWTESFRLTLGAKLAVVEAGATHLRYFTDRHK